MKFKVSLKNIKLYGFHGVYSSERKNGQKFEVDVEYIYTRKKSHVNDDISNVINYSEVLDLIVKVFNEKSWNLLETLAEEIKSSLMSKFSILDCSIKIRKPEVKLQCDVDFVELNLFGNKL